MDDAEIDRAYYNAVVDLRRAVEIEGEPWQEAADRILVSHTLGLTQIADLYRKAEEIYGS